MTTRDPRNIDEERYYNRNEVAKLLEVCRNYTYTLQKMGLLKPSAKAGRNVFFHGRDVKKCWKTIVTTFD